MKEQSWLEEGWIFHNHAWHLLHEFLKQIPKDTESLLDVGAGTGLAAAVIAAVYPGINVMVTDIAEESQEFWYKRNIRGLVLVPDESLPFSNNAFDIVMSSHVLEHVENPVPLIKEMFRVAHKRVIIAVPNSDVHFYDHKIIFDRTVLKNKIIEALEGEKYSLVMFPVYHPHINNLMAVIDK